MESRGAAPSASHPDSTPTGRRFSFGDRRKTYLTFPDTLYSRYKVLSVLSRPLFHLLHSPAVRRARMVRPIVPANILFTVPTKTVIEHQILHIQKDRRILDPGLPALSPAPAFSPLHLGHFILLLSHWSNDIFPTDEKSNSEPCRPHRPEPFLSILHFRSLAQFPTDR